MTNPDPRRLARKITSQDDRLSALETERRSQFASVLIPGDDGETVTVPVPDIYVTAQDAAGTAQDAAAAAAEAAAAAAALDAALDASRAEVEAGMSELGDRLGTAETELATTKEDVATVETDVATALDQASGALAEAQAVGGRVDVVSGALTAAQADITAAQSTASSAQTAAAAAQSTADAARSDASSAQSTADTAKADAATAAGIAGGKADVLIQATTPAASYRTATTLWIDTTGGANTPKRWSGSAWVAVTDRAATDAAAAAAAAQTTASNAATAAASAQSKADAAAAAAAAAATAAGNAQASADGKNTIWRQASAPAGTAHKTGDTWFDTDDGNRVYLWSGSAWTAAPFGTNAIAALAITNALIADATIQSAKIANLDAGKITAGTLDAARIGARSITADKVLITSGDNLLLDPGFANAPAWSLSGAATLQATGGRNGGGCLVVSGGSGLQTTYTSSITAGSSAAHRLLFLTRVQAGVTYRLGVWAKTDDASTAAAVGIVYGFTDEAGIGVKSNTLGIQVASPTAGQWQWVECQVTAPDGAAFLAFAASRRTTYTGVATFSDPSVTAMADASLIVDGAITTDKLAANSVTAAKMVAGTITAASGILADAVIETAKIKDAAVTNAKIASLEVGKLTAVSATVQTAVAQAIWAAKITAQKIVAGDIKAGEITAEALAADAIDGKVITGATLRTAATGKRLQIDSTGATSGQLRFYSGASTEQNPAYLVATPAGTGSSIVIAGGTTTAYPKNPPAISLVNDGTYTPYISMTAGQVEILAGLVVDAGEAIVLKTTELMGLEAVEVMVTGHLTVSGRDTANPGLSAIASGWSVTVAECIRKSGWCSLALALTPSSAWETSASGNVTDIALCTVSAGFRPAAATYLAGSHNAILGGSLGTDGRVYLSATAGGLTAGQVAVRIQFIYPLA